MIGLFREAADFLKPFTLRITADGGVVATEVEYVDDSASEILEDNTCKLSYYHYFCIVIHHAYNDAKIVK